MLRQSHEVTTSIQTITIGFNVTITKKLHVLYVDLDNPSSVAHAMQIAKS